MYECLLNVDKTKHVVSVLAIQQTGSIYVYHTTDNCIFDSEQAFAVGNQLTLCSCLPCEECIPPLYVPFSIMIIFAVMLSTTIVVYFFLRTREQSVFPEAVWPVDYVQV